MELKANWLSTLEVGSNDTMFSSYLILSPKNKNTKKEATISVYINTLRGLK